MKVKRKTRKQPDSQLHKRGHFEIFVAVKELLFTNIINTIIGFNIPCIILFRLTIRTNTQASTSPIGTSPHRGEAAQNKRR